MTSLFTKGILCTVFTALSLIGLGQKNFQWGLNYQYGAALNLHHTNDKVWPPSDISVPSLFFDLNAGENKLGIRATLGWRREDIRFHILERFYLKQTNKGVEMKLQCTVPISSKSSIALGMAPRIISKSDYMTEYKNELNNTFYGESTFVPQGYNGLNTLNAALSFSYYYQFAKRWQVSLHLDHDMLTTHKDDISTAFLFDESFNYEERFINGRLTSVSLALAFIIKSYDF